MSYDEAPKRISVGSARKGRLRYVQEIRLIQGDGEDLILNAAELGQCSIPGRIAGCKVNHTSTYGQCFS